MFFLITWSGYGQNIWIENSTAQWGCTVQDTIRLVVFDPNQLFLQDSIEFEFGDGTKEWLSLSAIDQLTDTSIFHEYPGCGFFTRNFLNLNYDIPGKNIQSGTQYYFDETIAFDIFTPYIQSPKFDLAYELTRCQAEAFYVHPMLHELDGDNMAFYFDTSVVGLATPDGLVVNETTGEIGWLQPVDTGVYQVYYRIIENQGEETFRIGRHLATFTIRVTDICNSLIAHDHLDEINLFEQPGRNFQVEEGGQWSYSYHVAKGDWDSINIAPASEIFQSQFSSNSSVIDLGDSLELILSWQTAQGHKRPHPYLLTHHITAWKNGKDHHRVLTNAIYVDWPTGTVEGTESKTPLMIYPNPASDQLMIEGFQGHPITVTIFDLVGRPLINKALYEGTIDIHQLQAGSYIVQIETPSGTQTSVFQKR